MPEDSTRRAPGGTWLVSPAAGFDRSWSAGKVAVVTGASRGLGAGLVARFVELGMNVAACARELPVLIQPPGSSPGRPPGNSPGRPPGDGDEPGELVPASVDVRDAVALREFADSAVERFGRVDLWVNNAGVLPPVGPLRRCAFADLRSNIEVNVLGVAYGSSVFASHVRERGGGGVLVNITSGAASRPYSGWAAYSASKAAVDQMTRVIALEEADGGLRAYALSPGVVDTPMQALVRASPPDAFPDVARFVDIFEHRRFNSIRWIADSLLSVAFGENPPGSVVLRVADEVGEPLG